MPEITPQQRKELEEKLKKMSPEEIAALQKQQCVFCQIVEGKIPSRKVYEDETCIAVLDINPAARGHLLLLPKEHYMIMPQIPDEVVGQMMIAAKKLSQALLRGVKASGTNIFIANGSVAGQKSQHFMIHIIPRKEGDKVLDIQEKYVEERLLENAEEAIQDYLYQLMGKKKIVRKQAKLEDYHTAESSAEREEEILRREEEKEEERKRPKVEEEKNEEKKGEGRKKKSESKRVIEKKEKSGSRNVSKREVGLDDIANLFK
jgi:histidine triad (HIT) family protein